MEVQELLRKFKVANVPSGNDILVKCLNPEHGDTNPSMRIDKVTGVFHCFACGFKGNIFTHFGVEQSRLDVLRNKVKKQIEKISLERVGLQIPDDAEYWDQPLRGISAATYKKFRAFTYEKEFPNRLVFPIYDITGKITNFCSRSFDPFEKPKYKMYPANSSPSIYPMTARPVFSTMILVEGIFDMLKMHDAGVPFCVTGFGTQAIDEEKLNIMRMIGVTELHLLFDGDKAGENASVKVQELAESKGFLVRNIRLREMFGEGTDPGSLKHEQIKQLRMKEWPEY